MVAAANACYNKGARVINISAGGTGYSSTEEAAYNNLRQNGALVFAAAGNNGNSQLFYPAAYSSVISVAATDLNYNRASFSNYNVRVDISAPGVGVYSTIHGGYASWAGTSMACPHAAGVAYRLWNEFPGCSSNQVLTAMTSTASDLGSSGKDVYTGNGFIRFWKARDYLISQNC
jgi:serine protease